MLDLKTVPIPEEDEAALLLLMLLLLEEDPPADESPEELEVEVDDDDAVLETGEDATSCCVPVFALLGTGELAAEEESVDESEEGSVPLFPPLFPPLSPPHPGIVRYWAPISPASGLTGTAAQLGLPCGAA